MLVVYPLPDKGYRYPYGVGVDCIIVCKAFGDASFPIIRTCPTLFVFQTPSRGDTPALYITSMSFNLRKLILASIMMPLCVAAFAQKETFDVKVNGGETTERFLVNWEEGFLGKFEYIDPSNPELGDNLVLSTPNYLTYLQTELNSQTVSMAERLKTVQEQMEIAAESITALAEAEENYRVEYCEKTENLIAQYERILLVYQSMGEDIEKRLDNMTRATRTRPSTFYPNLASILIDWDYSWFMVKFTEDYILDLAEEMKEVGEKFEEEIFTSEDFLNIYISIAETASQTCITLAEYYEAKQDILTYDNLVELHDMVVDNITSIGSYVSLLNRNPTEETLPLLQDTLDTLRQTKEEFDEASEEVVNLHAQLSVLPGLEAVLYSGVEGEPSGLAFNIIDNEGTLQIPSIQSYAGVNYSVTGIVGNLFTQYYDQGNPLCRKIIIPSSVKGISNEAFAVTGIKEVVVEKNASTSIDIPSLTDNCFTADTYADATLFVPDGTEQIYAMADGWKNFKTILPISQANIDEINSDNISVNISGDNLIISGAEGKPIEIYKPDGLKIYEGKENIINLPSSGIYIVRIGKSIFKVAR